VSIDTVALFSNRPGDVGSLCDRRLSTPRERRFRPWHRPPLNHHVVEAGTESPSPSKPRRLKLTAEQEIETWVAALGRYDNNEFDEALREFEKVSDTSKILFNMGVIHATLGEHEKAVSLPLSTGRNPWSAAKLTTSRLGRVLPASHPA
jgi:hypothetical protein